MVTYGMQVSGKAELYSIHIEVMMHFNFRKEDTTLLSIHFMKARGLPSSYYVHKLEIYTTFAV